MKTPKVLKFLTILSSSLAALMGGLATLPIPSESLPMPESWRPYLVSVAFIAAGVRLAVIPALDAAIKKMNEMP